jgi:hypothetical protein
MGCFAVRYFGSKGREIFQDKEKGDMGMKRG